MLYCKYANNPIRISRVELCVSVEREREREVGGKMKGKAKGKRGGRGGVEFWESVFWEMGSEKRRNDHEGDDEAHHRCAVHSIKPLFPPLTFIVLLTSRAFHTNSQSKLPLSPLPLCNSLPFSLSNMLSMHTLFSLSCTSNCTDLSLSLSLSL